MTKMKILDFMLNALLLIAAVASFIWAVVASGLVALIPMSLFFFTTLFLVDRTTDYFKS